MAVSPSAMMPVLRCWFSVPFQTSVFKSQTLGDPRPVVTVVRVFVANGCISELPTYCYARVSARALDYCLSARRMRIYPTETCRFRVTAYCV